MTAFFIQYNTQEIGAVWRLSWAEGLAYLYLKQNADFQKGTTKKISFGGLAGMLQITMQKAVTRTDASRLISKLIKQEMIEETEIKQVYRFKLCEKFDTITLNIKKEELKNNHIERAREDDEEVFSNSRQQKKKTTTNKTPNTQTTDKGASAPVKAATQPSNLEGKGLGAETTEAAQIRAHAKAEGWNFWDNPKSLPLFQKAGEASQKLPNSLPLLLVEYQSDASDPTPMGFKIFVDNYSKTHAQNQGQRRGDLVL